MTQEQENIKSYYFKWLFCALLSLSFLSQGEEPRHRKNDGSLPPLTGGGSPDPNAAGESFERPTSDRIQGLPPLAGSRSITRPGTESSDDKFGPASRSCEKKHSSDDYRQIPTPRNPQGAFDGGVYFMADMVNGAQQIFHLSSPEKYPEEISRFPSGVETFKASPDGRLVAAIDKEGSLRLVGLDSKKKLSGLISPKPWKFHSMAWNSQSKSLFAIASQPPHTETALFQWTPGKKATELTVLKGWFAVTDVSPNGRWVALTNKISETESTIFLWDRKTSTLGKIPSLPKATYEADAQFTEDSKGFFYLTNWNAKNRYLVYRKLQEKTSARIISPKTLPIESYVVNAKRDILVYLANQMGYSKLSGIKIDATGLMRSNHPLPPKNKGVFDGLGFSVSDTDKLFYAFSTSNEPQNLWRWSSPRDERWTRNTQEGVRPNCLRSEETVQYASFDGRQITGFLFSPQIPDAPYVILVHDGPESQYRPRFNHMVQYFVERGVGVLAPNIRGSSGFEDEFAELDNEQKKMDASKDLIAAAAYLVDKGIAHKTHIALLGFGHGGYLATQATLLSPKTFASLSLVSPTLDLKNSPQNRFAFHQPYYKRDLASLPNPLTGTPNLKDLKIPVLLFVSDNAPEAPLDKIRTAFAALLRAGIPRDLKVFSNNFPADSVDSIVQQATVIAYFIRKHIPEKKKK